MKFDIPSGAILSPCQQYRYLLWRRWDWARAPLLYIMLNPSTADATLDDATIRVCKGRAEHLGWGGIVVANLFALRATQPQVLYEHPDPVGPENNYHMEDAILEADGVICAWGRHGALMGRGAEVLNRLKLWGIIPMALKINADGSPAHPLRIPYSQPLVRL